MPKHIVAVVNLKGGVGKSTLAVSIACQMQDDEGSAVLVDADAQGSAAAWAAHGALPVRVDARAVDDASSIAAWVAWVRGLQEEWVILDCPPHFGAVTGAAIGMASLVVVPVGASGLDIAATRPTLALLAAARERRKDRGPAAMLVPSRVDARTAAGREIAQALAQLGEPVGPVVHARVAHADAFSAGMWIGRYATYSDAHNEIIALSRAVREALR